MSVQKYLFVKLQRLEIIDCCTSRIILRFVVLFVFFLPFGN